MKMEVMEDTSFLLCRNYVKAKLLRPAPVLRNHEKEKSQLINLFDRTVKHGESNSALLIGPRSSGKSVLINEILSSLGEDKYFRESAVIVYLNGLIHTDDAIALKAIAHQLGLDNVCEGRVFGSLAENLTFFLDCLKSGNREISKSTIMIIDEFDLFCSHSRQTLLYNLFDVAQSEQAPLCVVGVTCRLDVVELLEKRVKSRFSNRHIYLFPQNKRSEIYEVIELCQELLGIPEHVNEEKLDQLLVEAWNNEVRTFCKSREFQDTIRDLYCLDVSESTLRRFLVSVLSKLYSQCRSIKSINLNEVTKTYKADPKVLLLESLSVLELCLIIAMKHHYDIYDGEPFNFEMIVRLYLKFINQNALDYTTDRSVLMKAFENILHLEFIIPVKSSNNSILKEYLMYKLVLLPQQIKTGVQNYQNLPTEVRQWEKFCVS